MPNNDKNLHTLSVYVANKPGVLARVAQVFARRGFNIESLVVSPAVDGNFSRMTIGLSGDPSGLDQIIMQLSKLVDVLSCFDHSSDTAVMKEMGLIKIAVDAEDRPEALQIIEHFGCKTVDLTPTSIVVQIVGDPAKIDAFEEMIQKFNIIEIVRTGKVVMSRGEGMT
ncbi:MAG: acetolactate synthase small subunit [Kiritimatiellales bacterium]|nr:acetolactate synthase small subunit [Kiritimatiellales bacterium]